MTLARWVIYDSIIVLKFVIVKLVLQNTFVFCNFHFEEINIFSLYTLVVIFYINIIIWFQCIGYNYMAYSDLDAQK